LYFDKLTFAAENPPPAQILEQVVLMAAVGSGEWPAAAREPA